MDQIIKVLLTNPKGNKLVIRTLKKQNPVKRMAQLQDDTKALGFIPETSEEYPNDPESYLLNVKSHTKKPLGPIIFSNAI